MMDSVGLTSERSNQMLNDIEMLKKLKRARELVFVSKNNKQRQRRQALASQDDTRSKLDIHRGLYD